MFSFAIRYGNEADETDSSGEEDGEEGTAFCLDVLDFMKYQRGKAKVRFCFLSGYNLNYVRCLRSVWDSVWRGALFDLKYASSR